MAIKDTSRKPYIIDNDNSMDLDQAMFIEPNKDDGFFVSYALADGYYYCKSNSTLNCRASCPPHHSYFPSEGHSDKTRYKPGLKSRAHHTF